LIPDRLNRAKKEPSRRRTADPDIGADHPNDWLIWQLIDSAFPTGGFAHSSGLEAAWQQGEVSRREDLIQFLVASLQQCGHAALPLAGAAFDSFEDLPHIDSLCDVFMTNHIANQASRAQGRALLSVADRLFPSEIGKLKSSLAFGHYAPAWGACLRAAGVKRETAMRMFLFNHLRGILAAAVRLNIVGPMEAQAMQRGISAKAEEILKTCEALSLDEIAQTAPLLELWQGAQNRLYSRLFQS
jgi:urease accessory protein